MTTDQLRQVPITIPTLTLHQPLASLIEWHVKNVETRSWEPNPSYIGQTIAIHAGKTIAKYAHHSTECAAIDLYGPNWKVDIPTGSVLAVATLKAAVQVEEYLPGFGDRPGNAWYRDPDDDLGRLKMIEADHHGDYTAGRWLWLLDDVQSVHPRPQVRGKLGVWKWEPPEDVVFYTTGGNLQSQHSVGVRH